MSEWWTHNHNDCSPQLTRPQLLTVLSFSGMIATVAALRAICFHMGTDSRDHKWTWRYASSTTVTWGCSCDAWKRAATLRRFESWYLGGGWSLYSLKCRSLKLFEWLDDGGESEGIQQVFCNGEWGSWNVSRHCSFMICRKWKSRRSSWSASMIREKEFLNQIHIFCDHSNSNC